MSTAQNQLHYLELHELLELFRQRKLSPVELVQEQLQRIAALDGQLHSYARVTADIALQQARQAEQAWLAGTAGPLAGVPIGVKDSFDSAGVVTAAGMPLHAKRIPADNAHALQLLLDAGAVMPGKLQMTEGAFAIHHPDIPDPVNPWGGEHWTGASSSGSGVATAAGLCFAALGTDTGGSVRFPCAANGLSGLKPTWGRVSRRGVFDMAPGMDHVGPMARSVKDLVLLMQVIAGHDRQDPTSLLEPWNGPGSLSGSFAGLRVGVDERWISEGVDGVICQALDEVMALIRQGGGVLVSVQVPDTRAVSSQWEAHCGVQIAVAHMATYPQQAERYGPALSRLIEGGRAASGMAYHQVLQEAMAFTGAMDQLLAEVDVLLAPVQPYAAPTHEQLADLAGDPEANRRLIQFTAPFNASGHPCLSAPIGFTPQGLPLGGQLIARKGAEALLLTAGMALQQASDWHRQHPPGFA